jgi:cobalt-zinc-cadmium efflux system outer membrane protein
VKGKTQLLQFCLTACVGLQFATPGFAAAASAPPQPVSSAAASIAAVTDPPSSLPQASAADPGSITGPAPVRTISLRDCFEKADQSNREILSARWTLPQAKAAIRIAGAIPNPQFSLQAGFGDSFIYVFDGQTQQYLFTQQFQTAGKRTKKIEVARANYALTELQLDALHFDLHNRVRRAYAELAAAEAYDALIESQRNVAVKLLAIAQKRFAAGKAPRSEALQAELNVMQFDTQHNQAQGRLEQDSAALSLIIGEKPQHIEVIDVDDNGIFKLSAEKTDIVPQPTHSLTGLNQLLALAYDSRRDLKVSKQQVYANQKAVTLARTKKIPDIFVGAGGTYATFAKHQPTGLSDTGDWIGVGGFFNITMENPIFYQYQGEVQQAVATLRQSEKQVELQQTQVATDVVTAYNEVSVTRINIFEFQKNLLPTAAEVARVARRGYEVGATDLATAIIAQQQYQQTLSAYFDAVVAYQNAWADLEKGVGVPLRL